MAVNVAGLRKKIGKFADDTARIASRAVEQELREKAKTLSTWDYTHARRHTFLPHLELHGIEFERPDDPVLANPNSFPPVSHFHPRDHAGCRCRTGKSRRGVRRTANGPRSWRITSEPPRVSAARVGSARVVMTRDRMPEWAKPILSRGNWVSKVREAVRGKVSV
jgi:hypothetical protein